MVTSDKEKTLTVRKPEMLFIDLETTLNQVLFLTSDIVSDLFPTVRKVRSCP